MDFRQSMRVGPYTLVCQGYTQDTNPNYDSEYAVLDVYRNGKKITQLAPEKRFYIATDQFHHGGNALHPGRGPLRDLRGPESRYQPPHHQGLPQPAGAWIWIGVVIVVLGTFLALVPNLTRIPVRAAVAVPSPVREIEVNHA